MTKQLFVTFTLLLSNHVFASQEKNYETITASKETTISKTGDSVTTTEEQYQVKTEAGRSELSLYKVRFNSSTETFILIEAYSLKNTEKKSVAAKDIQTIKGQSEQNGLSDVAEATIPFNNLATGSRVYIKYQLKRKPLLGNIFSDMMLVSNDVLAQTEYYRYISDVPLQVYSEDMGTFFSLEKSERNGKFQVEVKPTHKAYSLVGVNLKTALFSVSTATSWKELNVISAQKFQQAISGSLPTPIDKIVAEAKLKNSKKEIIEFIASEINKKIAYSGNWTTPAGKMFPVEMQKSVGLGKGDCKDYATIMIAALRKIGFEAYPFLTFRSQSYAGENRLKEMAQIPNPSFFNHVIVWAKDSDQKIWWIDPTNPYVQADVITSDILGNFGLLLDGKSNQALFIPKENSDPSNITVEQTLKISSDNSVSGNGTILMSPSAYNIFALVERINGKEAFKQMVSQLLSPKPKIEIELKSNANNKTSYGFSFHASDWVEEQLGKFKAILIFNPVALQLNKVRQEADIDLGEPGTFKLITHLKGQKELDTIRASCLIRSKWQDVDRYVENKSDEITITDIIKTKVRFISKTDSKGDYFENFLNELWSCAKNVAIILKFDESLKTAQMISEDKLKGPSLESMTELDADALYNLDGPIIFSYRFLKLHRYYESKIGKNAKDTKAHMRMGQSIARLGYLSGENHVPEYLENSINSLDLALLGAEQNFYSEIAGTKIKYLLIQGRLNEAISLFSELNKKAPKDFYTYISAYRISLQQNKPDVAEQWLKMSESLAKTEKDKGEYNFLMAGLYEKQKKWKEAAPFRQALANQNSANPWAWHNLAIVYLELDDLDKTIEYEKKALSVQDFGVARRTLALAYGKKAWLEKEKAGGKRAPATLEKYENYLLEAIKYDEKSMWTLISLSEYYLENYSLTKDRSYINKGFPYVKRAAEIEPQNSQVGFYMMLYKGNSK